MICCETLGLDGADYCRGYIQNWNKSGEPIPEHSAQKIFRAADLILKAGCADRVEGELRTARPRARPRNLLQ
jgi:hypothetical protein